MEPPDLRKLERDYTLSQINWKRSYTEIDMKRRKAEKRERARMQINVINNIKNPSLGFEVEHFQLFGGLKKTDTSVHNTIPSFDTVTAEKDYIKFETIRKLKPHAVRYNDFYGCIQNEASKPRTPASSSGTLSSRPTPRTSPANLKRRDSNTPGLGFKPSSPAVKSKPSTPASKSKPVTPSIMPKTPTMGQRTPRYGQPLDSPNKLFSNSNDPSLQPQNLLTTS